MFDQPIHLFSTKNDLLDINAELLKFVRDNGRELVCGNSDTAQIAVFIISQYASDDFANENIHLTKNQQAYLEIVERYNNAPKENKPKIYLFVRSELYKSYKNWTNSLNDSVSNWLKKEFDLLHNQETLNQLLKKIEKGTNGFIYNNPINEFVNSIRQLNELFLHTDDDDDDHKKNIRLRRSHILLLYLFIFNHELNRTRNQPAYSDNWISTFNNIVDLKENLKYAIFPPRIAVDFHKALLSGGIPILAVKLQRFELISNNRYELYFEIINAGKTPIFPCNTETDFLRIRDKKNGRKISPPSTGTFISLPPVLAAGEHQIIRLPISDAQNDQHSEYLLIFRFRCVQSFTIKNRFVLQFDKNARNWKIVFLDYKRVPDHRLKEGEKT
jgi:hypothetical protein